MAEPDEPRGSESAGSEPKAQPEAPTDPGARGRRRGKSIVALVVILIGTALVVVALSEYRSRGAGAVSGLGVAGYVSQARSDAGLAPDFQLPPVVGSDQVSISGLRATWSC